MNQLPRRCLVVAIVLFTSWIALALPTAPGDERQASPGVDAAERQRAAVAAVLDGFHAAAAQADEASYFAHLSDDAIFLGTDASERWTKPQFRAYCEPHFSEGRGWTYVNTARHIDIDPSGAFAWFDELLHNEKYGQCRGSGVLVKRDGRWQIAQYNLSMPVPNEIALGVVGMIRGEPLQPTTIYVVRHAERADDGRERNPALSLAGEQRAQHLQRMLSNIEFNAIYSTAFLRTQQTVAPLAALRSMDVATYHAIPDLAARITGQHAGGNVLVAGHSNTVGRIIGALGISDPPKLSDADYGDVFIITLDAANRAGLQHLRMD